MVEYTAHCRQCGRDEGLESVHFDTAQQATFIKFTCRHTVRVKTVFEFMSKAELDELFPKEEGNSS